MSHANPIQLRSTAERLSGDADAPESGRARTDSQPHNATEADPIEISLVEGSPIEGSPVELPRCATAKLVSIDGERLVLEAAGRRLEARRDDSVHPIVLQGAHERGERVLAEHHGEHGWLVVGALHTQPVPGIDRAETYRIEADEVAIEGAREVSLSAQTATVVVRALGEVETYAERILSRAEGLHKIVGRMLNLN